MKVILTALLLAIGIITPSMAHESRPKVERHGQIWRGYSTRHIGEYHWTQSRWYTKEN